MKTKKIKGYKVFKVDENGYGCFQRYPDFGQPENFVKLLELKIPDGTKNTILSYIIKLMFLRYGMNGCPYNRGDFLLYLSNISTKNINQAIREAEWKYE